MNENSSLTSFFLWLTEEAEVSEDLEVTEATVVDPATSETSDAERQRDGFNISAECFLTYFELCQRYSFFL